MKPLSTIVLSAMVAFALTACNKAESPAEVSKDVSAAEQSAAKDSVSARMEATSENLDAQQKVAIEKCEALSGAEQKTCKEQADAALENAKIAAMNTRDAAVK